MITLDYVKSLWEKDSVIDETEAGKESLNIPQVHSRYYGLLIEAKRQLVEAQILSAKMVKIKHRYYLGLFEKAEYVKYNWEPMTYKILRQDLSIYAEADADLVNLNKAVAEQKFVVEYIEEVIKQINGRNYQISNHINWHKFLNGQQ